MIIDAHAHMDVFLARGWNDPPEKVIKYLDMANIDMAVVSTYVNYPGPNMAAMEQLYNHCNQYPGRFIPFLRMNPRFVEQTEEAVDVAVKKYGFKGIKFHPTSYAMHPFTEPTLKILRKAVEYDIPVLFHCSDECLTLPLQIAEAAEACPDAKIILAHMGGFYHREDAINTARKYKNVYVDMCEMPFASSIKHAVEVIGSEKVLFGTDLPTDNPIFEIEKVKMAGLSKEDEENIFFRNAAKLLKIDLEDVKYEI